MSSKNKKKKDHSQPVEPVFQTNTLTNYVYPDGDKSHPKLPESDVICAKEWVDENHK